MEASIVCKVRVQRNHQDHFGQEETVSGCSLFRVYDSYGSNHTGVANPQVVSVLGSLLAASLLR